MNILMVDKEREFVQSNFEQIRGIKDISIRMVGAYSAEEAMKIMEYFVPDLLITEINMFDMNGFTLITNARKKNLCEHFIIYTNSESFDSIYQALKCQVMDYLLKPCGWPALESNIRKLAMKPQKQLKIDNFMEQYEEIFGVLKRNDFSDMLQKAVCYAKNSYNREISLSSVSEYSRLSENSICNLFKKEMGITFFEYIRLLRLEKAVNLLLDDERATIHDIAYRVGYRSERQLFRIFKDKLGMTPAQLCQKYY